MKLFKFSKIVLSRTRQLINLFSKNLAVVVSWASAGTSGFRGTRKGTPYAAQATASNAIRTVSDQGMQRAEVMIKGPGLGRDAALRGIPIIDRVLQDTHTIDGRTQLVPGMRPGGGPMPNSFVPFVQPGQHPHSGGGRRTGPGPMQQTQQQLPVQQRQIACGVQDIDAEDSENELSMMEYVDDFLKAKNPAEFARRQRKKLKLFNFSKIIRYKTRQLIHLFNKNCHFSCLCEALHRQVWTHKLSSVKGWRAERLVLAEGGGLRQGTSPLFKEEMDFSIPEIITVSDFILNLAVDLPTLLYSFNTLSSSSLPVFDTIFPIRLLHSTTRKLHLYHSNRLIHDEFNTGFSGEYSVTKFLELRLIHSEFNGVDSGR
ncbi:hypothetical protein KSP40_PGU001090 [Platanthera guangdongensis]|uniref:Uncharacterized protein n=1 Tax=Platanthera guangdongensis TaxID=2320717 RepID=A0ABR2MZ88_9ASPA